MSKKHTPTEIIEKIKYKLIEDIGTLWACVPINNEGEYEKKTPQNITFEVKMNLLVDIISMEVANDK